MAPALLLNRRIAATLDAVDELCQELRKVLADVGWIETGFWVELLLREAMINAVLHGCRGDPARRVEASVSLAETGLRLTVQDDGDGFDWRQALRRALPSLEDDSGRGLALMTRLAADIQFNERGNAVAMLIPRRLAP